MAVHTRVILLWIFLRSTSALSHNGVYKIVGIPGTGTQHLPESYVKTFARWQLTPSHGLVPATLEPLPLQHKQVRPSLNFLIKGGTPAYIMAGLQISTTGQQVLAQQWTTFRTAVEPNFRLVVYQGNADGADERILLVDSQRLRSMVEQLGMALSMANTTAVIADAFHVVSMPLDWIPVEKDDTVTCVLTAENDAREVFTLDQDLVEMTATSLLIVGPNMGN